MKICSGKKPTTSTSWTFTLAEDEIDRVIGLRVSEVERYCTIKHFDLAGISVYDQHLSGMLKN